MTADEARATRCGLLRHRGNPRADLNYLVELDGRAAGGAAVQLTYVPDRLVLEDTAFDAYLAALRADETLAVEALALTILDDIGNEIVPRWVRAVVAKPRAGARIHRAIAEDRQPNWDDPHILANVRNALNPVAGGDTD